MVTLKGEGVHRNADQQTAFSLLFQDGRASAAAWATGNVCVCSWERRVKAHQVWPQGQQKWEFSTDICFGLRKSEGKKWLRLKVENKSQEMQSTLQEDEEEQEAAIEGGLQELS